MGNFNEAARNILSGLSGSLQGENMAMMDAWQQIEEQKKAREQKRQFDMLSQQKSQPTLDDWKMKVMQENVGLLSPDELKRFVFGKDVLGEADKPKKGIQYKATTPKGEISGDYSPEAEALAAKLGGQIPPKDSGNKGMTDKEKAGLGVDVAGLFKDRFTGRFDLSDTTGVKEAYNFISRLAGVGQDAAADSSDVYPPAEFDPEWVNDYQQFQSYEEFEKAAKDHEKQMGGQFKQEYYDVAKEWFGQ